VVVAAPEPVTITYTPDGAVGLLMWIAEQLVPPIVPVGRHAPVRHDMPEAHAWPHAPQFDESVMTFTSQPSAAIALQSANPAPHNRPQCPLAHVAVA
jgi:hypothetical protein